jgi:hypothetical protein
MKAAGPDSVVTMAPLFLRRRDVAKLYGVSESLVLIMERRGWLTPVRLPEVRAVRYAREDVEALAAKIRAGEMGEIAVDGAVPIRRPRVTRSA